MFTSRKISTISYNTQYYLDGVLQNLYKRGVISFYAYIKHKPEEDEKKEHFHVFIEPAEKIETKRLNDILTEFTNVNELPLKSMNFHTSNFGDWYLYCKHDKSYLFSKGQSRRFHYDRSAFFVSDDLFFTDLIHQIDMSKFTRLADFIEMVDKGFSFDEIIRKGKIPVNQFLQYKAIYVSLVESKADENNIIVNSVTGEVLDHTNRGERGKTHE